MIILLIFFLTIVLIFSIRYPWWLPTKNGLIVLMYHHIYKYDNTCDLDKELYIDPIIFEKQLKFLIRHKYNPITFEELINSYTNGIFKLPKKSILITFDDGWLDNYTIAYPILKKYNLKANIFLAYNYIGKNNCMTWNNIIEMKNSGLISFGSHTISHNPISSLTTDNCIEELKISKKLIEEKIKSTINCFAYPKGDGANNTSIRNLVFQNGYLFDFSTKRGITKFKYNKNIAIKRLYVKNSFSLLDFYLLITKGKNSF